MDRGKPSVDDILSLAKKLEDYYNPLMGLYEKDELFYELAFKSQIDMPDEFADAAIVLPTARDFVDTFVDHIDIANARVFANKKGVFKKSEEEAEMFRKFGLGVLHMTNLMNDISQWRVSGKHFALHGLGGLQTLWDADMWDDKPQQKDGESTDNYAERIDEWREKTHESLPIVIRAVHPHNLLPDPAPNRTFIIEKSEIMGITAQEKYPKWSNPDNRKIGDLATKISFWSKQWHCELLDGEPILNVTGGVDNHKYGFIPYVLMESGLGNMGYQNKPEHRYVGILRYIYDLLLSESRDYSVSDVILGKTAWGGGYLKNTGNSDVVVKTLDVGKFGTWQQLPPGIEPVPITHQVPPEALNNHLSRTSYYLQAHAAPSSLRGMSEEGVRSGADRRLVISEAMARFNYASEAFQSGAAKVLINCAKLLKNVIPGDVRVWARTPTDEFDEIIEKDKLKEPFTCYVEFSPISDEDEYRRHDDLERLVAGGIVTRKWARQQMANVDAKAMELEEEKERIKNDPMLQQMISSYAQAELAKAIQARVGAEAILEMGVVSPLGGAPVAGMGTPEQGMQAGRRLIPPVPNTPPIGSAQEAQNQMKGMRSQTPMSPTQGQGGGGNRP